MPDAVGNGTDVRARPKEHLVIERLDQILKRPAILESHIAGMKRSLIANPDVIAVDSDRDGFRSPGGYDGVFLCCPEKMRCAKKSACPADPLNISLIRQVKEMRAK